MSTIRLAGVVTQSITDGPGLRFTVFTQGCPHKCKGCHNPETWDFDGGKDYNIDDLLSDFDSNPLLKGATLSGGEPLVRAGELLPFAKAIKERGKDIVCFTGFLFEDILEKSKTDADLAEILKYIDILVDGPFVLELRDISDRFKGSSNQRVIDIPKSFDAGEVVIWSDDYSGY